MDNLLERQPFYFIEKYVLYSRKRSARTVRPTSKKRGGAAENPADDSVRCSVVGAKVGAWGYKLRSLTMSLTTSAC